MMETNGPVSRPRAAPSHSASAIPYPRPDTGFRRGVRHDSPKWARSATKRALRNPGHAHYFARSHSRIEVRSSYEKYSFALGAGIGAGIGAGDGNTGRESGTCDRG